MSVQAWFPQHPWSLLKETAADWMEDNALRLSAALAYYSVFSIAPLLVIAISIAGLVFGSQAVHGQLGEQLKGTIGAQSAEAVQSMVQSASKPSSSVLMGFVGVVTLLIGASGVFAALKDALNTIWEVQAKPGLGIMGFVKDRLLSFGMVLVIGFLLLASLMLTTAVSAMNKFFGDALGVPTAVWAVIGFLVSFGVVTVLFAAIFKMLPDVKIEWRQVWVGAAVTALLFVIGKLLLGWYLGRESAASSYGAATSVVLLLLWIYYTTLILLFGAEFTQVYARAMGATIEPTENAEPVTAEKRAQEGLSPKTGATAALPKRSTDPAAPQREMPRMILGVERDVPVASPVPSLLLGTGVGVALALLLRARERHVPTRLERAQEDVTRFARQSSETLSELWKSAAKRGRKAVAPLRKG